MNKNTQVVLGILISITVVLFVWNTIELKPIIDANTFPSWQIVGILALMSIIIGEIGYIISVNKNIGRFDWKETKFCMLFTGVMITLVSVLISVVIDALFETETIKWFKTIDWLKTFGVIFVVLLVIGLICVYLVMNKKYAESVLGKKRVK